MYNRRGEKLPEKTARRVGTLTAIDRRVSQPDFRESGPRLAGRLGGGWGTAAPLSRRIVSDGGTGWGGGGRVDGGKKRIKSLLSSISDYLNSAQVLSSLAERAQKRDAGEREQKGDANLDEPTFLPLPVGLLSACAPLAFQLFLAFRAASSAAGRGAAGRSTIDELARGSSRRFSATCVSPAPSLSDA